MSVYFATGFYFDVFLHGEKCAPLPLGGISGLAKLLSTIRELPVFSKVDELEYDGDIGENVRISTVTFAQDVSIFRYILLKYFFCINYSL